MWNFGQGEFALALVQKWPYKNEVIDLRTNKFKKLSIPRVPHFKFVPMSLIQNK
jgi:hypothetical protein